MGKTTLAVVVLLLALTGCGTNQNKAACEGFMNRFDSVTQSAADHRKAGDTGVADSLMRGLPDSLGEFSDKATGDVRSAMDKVEVTIAVSVQHGSGDITGPMYELTTACGKA